MGEVLEIPPAVNGTPWEVRWLIHSIPLGLPCSLIVAWNPVESVEGGTVLCMPVGSSIN